jgi:hypothetical protein
MMRSMVKNPIRLFVLAIGGLFLIGGGLYAHHSHQFTQDYSKVVAVTGIVTGHDFVNPHCLIHVTATDKNGNQVEWAGYGGTPAMEKRLGYSSQMFKIGEERITMYGFPNKDGRKFMIYTALVRANGQAIPIYQTLKHDMDAFLKLQNVRSLKELPATSRVDIGGNPYLPAK